MEENWSRASELVETHRGPVSSIKFVVKEEPDADRTERSELQTRGAMQ